MASSERESPVQLAEIENRPGMSGLKAVLQRQAAQKEGAAIGLLAQLTAARHRLAKAEEQAAKRKKQGAELEPQVSLRSVPVARLRRNPWQKRITFDEAALAKLAASIKEVGLVHPVLVRPVVDSDGEAFYEIISGERRWRAHQLSGMAEIEVIIQDATDGDMVARPLAEKATRESLSDYEIGRAIRRSERDFPDQKPIADSLGLSHGDLSRYLAFDNLPEFMLIDLEQNPSIFGGKAANDACTVLEKYGSAAVPVARDLWTHLISGSLEEDKFAQLLEDILLRREAPPVMAQRDIRKLYAGKIQVGSITKDEEYVTIEFWRAELTPAQDERAWALLNELFDEIVADA